ncbi:telomere length regulation protein TEL2 homolog isoform X2 [Rana temporaria]|uniref:telomere length regulation protein TEL2 homolog isoform X2 n=1 Tax=Rana temporaria TaxID=8407 RepID=UPI001AACD9EB|nr:telomere length regulation protein TEL2 homolog isoform X2 [Rana temporaria]
MMDQDILSVRSAVYGALADLSKISDGDRLVEVLTGIKCFLGKGENAATAQETGEFHRTHYTPFLRVLVTKMGPQWLDLLTSEHLDLWDSFFLEGPADQAFLVLVESLGQTGPSARLDHCVHVLEKFLQRGALAEVIWEVCEQQLEATPTPVLHEAILAKICNLPDHVANCLQKHNKSIFYPQNYFPRIGNAILKVLQMVSVSLRDGKGCSINFVSQLLGKVCMQGRQRELFSVLLPRLTALVQSDCIWQRICWRLVESVPDRWMEPVVTGLAQMAPGPSALSQLLGDLVLKNKKTQFIVTQKLLFLQYGHKNEMLQTILGYLALENSRRALLIKVLRELLDVWSSGSMVKHSSYPQMLHLSRCIFICISLLNKEEMEGCKQELLHALTSGTRLYLDSSLPPVRCLGMVVAECLSQQIKHEGPSLSFQYGEDDDIKDLKSLLNPPCICPSDPPDNAKNTTESDDDLTPYDMSADTELKKNKTPSYIRDCMEVLLSDDVEKVEVTMSSLANLIRSNSAATKEVSTELAKILLHLDGSPGVENFTPLRFAAMVAVIVTDPVLVSQYLTGEFYSLNYSLRQRMDILDALASAAQELSDATTPIKLVGPEAKAEDSLSARHPVVTHQSEAPVDWRKVVEERIASKTKRFSKGQTRATPTPTPNRFHAVAGYFFFPLIQNYDRPVVTFNLLGEDHLILGRLVHTLGILMHLAQHATVVSQMGKALLEFVWVLHFHSDPFVRQGLLFCVSTVLLSVPWERLMTDMAEEVLEMKCWLADIAEKESDEDCRRLAVNGLILMDKLRNNLQPAPLE